MAHSHIDQFVSAWDKVETLSRYQRGSNALVVGWWRGQAYVHIWDYRRGSHTWRPLHTTRPEPPLPPPYNPFESSALYDWFTKRT
jgi:hypothetical protein